MSPQRQKAYLLWLVLPGHGIQITESEMFHPLGDRAAGRQQTQRNFGQRPRVIGEELPQVSCNWSPRERSETFIVRHRLDLIDRR